MMETEFIPIPWQGAGDENHRSEFARLRTFSGLRGRGARATECWITPLIY